MEAGPFYRKASLMSKAQQPHPPSSFSHSHYQHDEYSSNPYRRELLIDPSVDPRLNRSFPLPMPVFALSEYIGEEETEPDTEAGCVIDLMKEIDDGYVLLADEDYYDGGFYSTTSTNLDYFPCCLDEQCWRASSTGIPSPSCSASTTASSPSTSSSATIMHLNDWSINEQQQQCIPAFVKDSRLEEQIARNAEICRILSPIRKYQERMQILEKKANQQKVRRKFSLVSGGGIIKEAAKKIPQSGKKSERERETRIHKSSLFNDHSPKVPKATSLSVRRWQTEIWSNLNRQRIHACGIKS